MVSDPVEQRTCRRCSAPLGAQDRFCQGCGAPVAAAEGRTCPACRAAVGPAARFCPRCGARVSGAWVPGLQAVWKSGRARAAAVDWRRVGLTTLPVAALLLAGLAGYLIGHYSAKPAAPSTQVVSAERGWRAATPGTPQRPGTGVPGAAPAAGLAPAMGPESRAASPLPPASRPVRFRDFRITASSWEYANPPALAADGDPYTAWHAWETERFSTGDWLTLTFPTPRLVARIGLIPGRIGPRARQDGRVRSILVKAPGAAPQKLIFADRPEMQYRDLNHPVLTRKLILRVITVLPGTRSSHIIIPEVQVWGYPAPGRIARRPGG